MKTINFIDIYCSLLKFQPDIQISYLTKQEIIKNFNFPTKNSETEESKWIKDNIDQISKNSICLIIMIKNGCLTFTKALEVLNNIQGIQIKKYDYFNKKMAAVMAGLGQYAKNQLIYNQDFGFDNSIETYFIYNDVINLPLRNKSNYSLLSLCDRCNLCEVNCPAKAIHIEENGPCWLDAKACRSFYTYGDHPIIPSVKYIVNTFLGSPYTEEELKTIKDYKSFKEHFNCVNKEHIVEKDGQKYRLGINFCNECLNQIPCRKSAHTYDKNNFCIDKI